jgi:predicted signal transduction protein with EAL and GGDEF domain
MMQRAGPLDAQSAPARERATVARSGEPFALLPVDVDDFKAVNDRHGHAAGDAALVALARTLAGVLRAVDTVALVRAADPALYAAKRPDEPQQALAS